MTDDDGGVGIDTLMVTVNNVAPTVNAGGDQTGYSGDIFNILGYFTDPGWLDTHTAIIDWGDGTIESGIVSEFMGAGTVSGSHVYLIAGIHTLTLTVTDDDGGVGADTLTITVMRITISIDIKPGSDPNSINLKSKGVITVAILNDGFFDPTLIDVSTVEFGPLGAKPVHWAYEDVDSDGDLDLILHFKTQEVGLEEGDTSASLIADLTDGRQIIGEDSVNIVPQNNKYSKSYFHSKRLHKNE